MLKQKFYVPGHDKKPEHEIVGEAHHYDELTDMFKDKLKPKDRVDIEEVMEATIEKDSDNADDKNAVAVKINGTTVGHLAADKATELSSRIALLEEKGYVAATKAKVCLWSKGRKIVGGDIKIGLILQEFEKALAVEEFKVTPEASEERASTAPQEGQKPSVHLKKSFSLEKYKKLVLDRFRSKK